MMIRRQESKSTPNPININEKRRRLFNIIAECVIPEINTLRAMPGNWGMQQATESEKALDRLRRALIIKSALPYDQGRNWGALCVQKIVEMNLDSIDDMLDARFDTWQPELAPSISGEGGSAATFVFHISLKQALNICSYNVFNWFPLSLFSGTANNETELLGTWGPIVQIQTNALFNVEQAISEQDIRTILKTNTTIRTTMINFHSQIINADTLCDMIMNWKLDSDTYSHYLITKKEIDTFVPLRPNLNTGTSMVHLGSYNALILAVSVCNLKLVKYFIEEKQADITVKAGIYGDLTLIDCAKRSQLFYLSKQNSQPVVEYLESKFREKKQLLNVQIAEQSMFHHRERSLSEEQHSLDMDGLTN